jgi:hypothetical protein
MRFRDFFVYENDSIITYPILLRHPISFPCVFACHPKFDTNN